jgi:2-keto-4-pentenoate hydratase/2-oxohepta-3-ene-1,7-dioic acid hydratase in catechol pathway
MKLATFSDGGASRVAVVTDKGLVDLAAAAPGLPRDMTGLIAAWPTARAEVERAVASETRRIALESVRLLAPVPRPGKMLAIGLNYADHIAESGQKTPEHQVWFAKMSTSAHGPFEPIELPKASMFVDYEAELVAVIGVRARNITRESAPAAVFGYAAGNDVTARDWQFQTPQWVLGKSFDTHGPFGPWIVTADEVGDPHSLGIRAFVNGEKRQDSNTRNLVFDVYDQIAHVSKVMTLEPGDVIFTGTPGGVGGAMSPPQALKAGDRVRVEIDRVGAIEASMQPEAG